MAYCTPLKVTVGGPLCINIGWWCCCAGPASHLPPQPPSEPEPSEPEADAEAAGQQAASQCSRTRAPELCQEAIMPKPSGIAVALCTVAEGSPHATADEVELWREWPCELQAAGRPLRVEAEASDAPEG